MSAQHPTGTVDPRTLEAVAKLLGQEVIPEPASGPASAVVRPGSVEEVAAVLRAAEEARLPVHPVGGLPSHRHPPGLILDLSRLNAILEMNAEDMLAVVQAGVPLLSLAATAEAAGLWYPPAFLACRQATVGGSLARGGGTRGHRHGSGRDYALGLRVVLANGQVMSVGSRAIKNATGYNLTQFLIGSRGALAVIVEATLRLVPKTSFRRTLVSCHADDSSAVAAALGLRGADAPLVAAELLDREALEAMRPRLGGLVPAEAGAAVLLLLEGAREKELAASTERAAAALLDGSPSQLHVVDDAQAEAVWTARRRLVASLAETYPNLALVEVGLPPAAVASFTTLTRRLASQQRIAVAVFGGIVAGSLTVGVLSAAGGSEFVASFCRRLAAKACALGGGLADVDGVGLTYADWLEAALPQTTAAMLRQLKGSLDPGDVLHPAHF